MGSLIYAAVSLVGGGERPRNAILLAPLYRVFRPRASSRSGFLLFSFASVIISCELNVLCGLFRQKVILLPKFSSLYVS
jgi:hypothetical protein